MIGKEFKRRRQGMKLTQRELGELLGYDEMSISRFERGEREIPRSVALAIDNLGIQHFLKLESSYRKKRLIECCYSEHEA
jgi:transcriptional regulator with XRE-family HTH domain